jgi:hypothetical protein
MSDLTQDSPPAVVRAAGWYPDPTRAADLRWWNGKQWTDETRARKVSSAPPLAAWGILAGLLLPIVGVVIAIVLFVRNEIGPGLAALLASGLGFAIAIAYLGG